MSGRVAAWVAAGAVSLAIGGSARAEVRGLNFPVRGMVCPLCTRGVEESIRRLRGVASVSADLATGRVDVEVQEGQSLNIEEVRQRAVRAGFPINGEADVLARGHFVIGAEGRITFRVTGTAYAWQVLEGRQLLALFRSHPTLKGEFLAGLRLYERPPFTRPAVALTRFEPAGPPVGRPARP